MQLTVAASDVLVLLLASVRAAAWLVIAPPFSSRGVPGPVKALLALALALPVVSRLGDSFVVPDIGGLATAVAVQVVAGAGLGFGCQLLFSAVQAAGDLLDIVGGFAMAAAYDPLMATNSSVMGRMYQATALALLFVTNGHLVVLHGFLRTYDLLGLDGSVALGDLTASLASALAAAAGQFMLATLQIAGPLLGVLFLADVALGLLTRIAPALNPFAIMFPMKILITLFLVGGGVLVLPDVVRELSRAMTELVTGVAAAGGGS